MRYTPFVCPSVRLPVYVSVTMSRVQWRNTHWTRLDKCQGPPKSRGPKPDPKTFYGRPLSVSGRPCYILPMFFLFFYGRLILRPW